MSIKQKIQNLIASTLGFGAVERLSKAKWRMLIPLRRSGRYLMGVRPERGPSPSLVLSEPRKHVFFGYYDINPFSHDETLLLATHAPDIGCAPDGRQSMDVGYYRLDDIEAGFHKSGDTTTWCWQQGCRLQWYPGIERRLILYNRMVGSGYGAVVQDAVTGEVLKKYRCPLYAVSRDGRYALSLNYSRLQRLRPGYGYGMLPDASLGNAVPDDDGVWSVDMESGQKHLLLSLKALASIDPLQGMSGADHYVNHLEFNAHGSRFVFVHLWVKKGLRNSRLVSSDRDGSAVHILNNSGHTSHHCWKSNGELLAFATHKETGMAYYEYVDRCGARAKICSRILQEDGHPSSLGDDLVMVDTYPDKYGDQCIYLYNTAKGALRRVVRVYSKLAMCGQYRCDLHHRVGPLRQHVCIDASSCSLRCMHVYNMPDMLSGKEVDAQ